MPDSTSNPSAPASKTTPAIQDIRERYRVILQPIQNRETFTAKSILESCPGVTLQAVHEVLRRLRSDGWLAEVQTANDPPETRRAPRSTTPLRWQKPPRQFAPEQWIEHQVCGTQVTASPPEERPRERLLRLGAAELRTSELLAILIRTGRKGESAVQAGQRIANRFSEGLDQLHAIGMAELKSVSTAISEPAYCQIMAGIELGRRVTAEWQKRNQEKIRINSADAAVDYCRQLFDRLAMDARQEEFHTVTLDTKYQPLTNHRITVGTLDASLVHPREVFRPAIRDAAAAVLLVHNHPSGDPTPSKEDRQVTRQLEAAGRTLGIQVLDHIIVAGDTALSLKQWEAGQS